MTSSFKFVLELDDGIQVKILEEALKLYRDMLMKGKIINENDGKELIDRKGRTNKRLIEDIGEILDSFTYLQLEKLENLEYSTLLQKFLWPEDFEKD